MFCKNCGKEIKKVLHFVLNVVLRLNQMLLYKPIKLI